MHSQLFVEIIYLNTFTGRDNFVWMEHTFVELRVQYTSLLNDEYPTNVINLLSVMSEIQKTLKR